MVEIGLAAAVMAWGWEGVGFVGKKGKRRRGALQNVSDLKNFEFKYLNLRSIFWSQNRLQNGFSFVK